MISFRSIEPQDREWMTACRDPALHPFSALSFSSLFAWRKTYGLSVAGDEDCFIIRSEHDQAYFAPCGDAVKCAALMEEIRQRERHPRFLYLTREQVRELLKKGFVYYLRDDLSEYVSSVGSLALREGFHASESYRVKVRRFLKKPGLSFRFLEEEDLPALRDQVSGMVSGKNAEDEEVLREELDHFRLLGLRGMLLETAEGKKAIILGFENTPEEFTMTMTKHDPSLPPQVTAVLMHALAKELPERYRLVNLEEDLGLAGLRQAKMLYSPVDRLNVYEAIG